jgi:asparagine synthase (glutamine-hydrolysing)
MNSLEVRAPYLDIDLVDFVRKIPSRFKFRNGQTKYLLKKALEPILPKPIVHRTKKGFGIPIGRWLRNGVAMIDPQTFSKFLNTDFIRLQISGHQAGKADNRAFLWNLWVLERWGVGIKDSELGSMD